MKNKNIHVLYVITKLELGGAQKVCLSLMKELHKNGQAPFLISGTEGPLVNTVQSWSNVTLLPSLKREVSLQGLWCEFKNFYTLYRTIRAYKKQYPQVIIHTHSTKAGLIGRWAAFFAGVKTRIHTIHGYGFHPHQSYLAWIITYTAELVTSFITTHYICVSSADVKTGIRLFPRFTYKHSIIRAAVDWQQFYTPARITNLKETKTFVFGTVSCFKPQKNLFDMLKAFAAAYTSNKNIRLEIIGDGAQRSEIEAWINQHNLEKNITLHGWQANVASFMQQWDAFLLTSLWEGLPCAIIEARLQKLPVLAYNTGGIHDVIQDDFNGYLYQQGDWRRLADDMITISTNPTLHQKLCNTQENLHEFDAQYMAEKHLRLYQKLSK